jgi:23S rRNA (uracil1939-C5)-methyltransferase
MEKVKLLNFVPGGQALGELSDGRKVFVWGGLPGELVSVKLYKVKASYAEGVAVEILEPSPHRVEPRDDCYLSTSPWQILEYDYELQQKAALVRGAFGQEKIELPSHNKRTKPSDLDKGCSGDTEEGDPQKIFSMKKFLGEESVAGPEHPSNELGFVGEPEYFYRNKMEYALYWDNDENFIKLAFHKRGTHAKIPITTSSIERPEILAEARRIVDDLNARNEPARKYQSLVVRCDKLGQVSSALFENGRPHPVMKNLSDRLLGHEFSYSPNGFFQINLPVYEMALTEIKKHIATDNVVDLYAGVGTIGLSVAADKNLTLVETNPAAFSELEQNVQTVITGTPTPSLRVPAKQSSVAKITPIMAKTENSLNFIKPDSTIIVDPPRAGLDDSVVAKLYKVSPPTIIYLSCNPTTQARDIAKLLPKYQILHHRAFNFFPRTPHIENLVVLQRKMI